MAVVASTYGWTHSDVLSLSVRQFYLYLRNAHRLTAESRLHNAIAALLPYQDKQSVRRTLQMYRNISEGDFHREASQEVIDASWERLRKSKGKGILM